MASRFAVNAARGLNLPARVVEEVSKARPDLVDAFIANRETGHAGLAWLFDSKQSEKMVEKLFSTGSPALFSAWLATSDQRIRLIRQAANRWVIPAATQRELFKTAKWQDSSIIASMAKQAVIDPESMKLLHDAEVLSTREVLAGLRGPHQISDDLFVELCELAFSASHDPAVGSNRPLKKGSTLRTTDAFQTLSWRPHLIDRLSHWQATAEAGMLMSETVEELNTRYDDCIDRFGTLSDAGWLQLVCHPCIPSRILDEIISSDRFSERLMQVAIARGKAQVDRTSDLATADPDVWFDAWSRMPTAVTVMIGWWAVTGGLLAQVGKETRTDAFFHSKVRDLVGHHLGMTAIPLDMLPDWVERYRSQGEAKLAEVEALYSSEPTTFTSCRITRWWDSSASMFSVPAQVRVMDLALLVMSKTEARMNPLVSELGDGEDPQSGLFELLVSELGDGEDPQSGTAWKMLFAQLDTIVDPETKLGLLISTAARLAV